MPANYTFSVTLTNQIPVNGKLKIKNVPGLTYGAPNTCTPSVGTPCTISAGGDIELTLPAGANAG
jgi:hypothetical protein